MSRLLGLDASHGAWQRHLARLASKGDCSSLSLSSGSPTRDDGAVEKPPLPIQDMNQISTVCWFGFIRNSNEVTHRGQSPLPKVRVTGLILAIVAALAAAAAAVAQGGRAGVALHRRRV